MIMLSYYEKKDMDFSSPFQFPSELDSSAILVGFITTNNGINKIDRHGYMILQTHATPILKGYKFKEKSFVSTVKT